jgi:opacity protein-like surface antigen
MKTRNYLRLVITGVVVSGLSLAQPLGVFGWPVGTDKIFSIGPRATYSTPNDADEGRLYTGAQARLLISPNLGLEGSIDFRRNDFSQVTVIKTYPVQVSVLAYLTPDAVWSPFFIGGAGLYYTQVDGAIGSSRIYSRFGLHAGAGLEIMLNEAVTLDGRSRSVWLDRVPATDTNALDKTYEDSGTMITVAVNFLF